MLELFAAAVIATYAMIGGAILNAAITNPKTCAPVLTWLYRWFRPLSSSAIALVIFAAGKRYFDGTLAGLFSDPLFWIAVAQAILLTLFSLAQRFVIEASNGITDDGRSTNQDGESHHPPL